MPTANTTTFNQKLSSLIFLLKRKIEEITYSRFWLSHDRDKTAIILLSCTDRYLNIHSEPSVGLHLCFNMAVFSFSRFLLVHKLIFFLNRAFRLCQNQHTENSEAVCLKYFSMTYSIL